MENTSNDDMIIKFSDLYNNEIAPTVCRDLIEQVISNPDKQYSTTLGDQQSILYTKYLMDESGNPYYLLVACRVKDNLCDVDLAFVMLSELVNNIDTIEPIDLLRTFVNRFGLDIKIGYTQNKFIHHQTFWVDTTNPTKIVEILNPDNHPFIQVMWFKVDKHGHRGKLDVHMAYCIEKENYLKWIKDVRLPESKRVTGKEIDMQEGSVDFWIKKGQVHYNDNQKVVLLDLTTKDGSVRIVKDSDNALKFTHTISGKGETIAEYDVSKLSSDKAHMVAATWSIKNKEIVLYIDGEPVIKTQINY